MAQKRHRLVYSTGGDEPRSDAKARTPQAAAEDVSLGLSGVVRVGCQRAGRKGKTVTLIEPLVTSRSEARQLLKELKQRCGVGGTVKEVTARSTGRAEFQLELQGDQRQRAAELLRQKQLEVRLLG